MMQPQGWKPVQEAESEDDRIFEVVHILESRESGKDDEFLVQWKVFPASAATWEPFYHFAACKDLLRAFRPWRTRRRKKPNTHVPNLARLCHERVCS